MNKASAKQKARHLRFLENMRRMNEHDFEEPLDDTTPEERIRLAGELYDLSVAMGGRWEDPAREQQSVRLAELFRQASRRLRR